MSESEGGASPSFRYFYTDPLAAAWMAQHFGMRFCIKIFSGGMWDGEWCDVRYPIPTQKIDHYIHPDSLHLLEPQVGDIFDNGAVVAEILKNGLVCRHVPGSDQCDPDDIRGPVIARDGKPFFWPEREAV